MKKFIAVFFITFSFFGVLVSSIHAQNKPNVQGNLGTFGNAAFGTTSTKPLPVIIGNIVSTFLGLLGIIAIGYVLYGGFVWMTAGGDDGKVTEAKNILRNSIIGLAIILSAYAISSFVTSSLITATVGS